MPDDMPEEDDYRRPELPWPAGQRPYPPAPTRNRPARYGVLLLLTAVIATGAGFLAVIAVRDLSASPAAAASAPPTASTPQPSASVPAPSGGAAIPTPGPGETLRLEIGGKVTAVSATSITVTAGGKHVTAAVTGATKVSGRVSGISGVKPGDLVSAEITGTDGKLTATAIQDPASLP